jgi:hypothetical protein
MVNNSLDKKKDNRQFNLSECSNYFKNTLPPTAKPKSNETILKIDLVPKNSYLKHISSFVLEIFRNIVLCSLKVPEKKAKY